MSEGIKPVDVAHVETGEPARAAQWTGDREDVEAMTDHARSSFALNDITEEDGPNAGLIQLQVIDRDGTEVTADPGDWVVLTQSGLLILGQGSFDENWQEAKG